MRGAAAAAVVVVVVDVVFVVVFVVFVVVVFKHPSRPAIILTYLACLRKLPANGPLLFTIGC
jgi:hypothetical protein